MKTILNRFYLDSQCPKAQLVGCVECKNYVIFLYVGCHLGCHPVYYTPIVSLKRWTFDVLVLHKNH